MRIPTHLTTILAMFTLADARAEGLTKQAADSLIKSCYAKRSASERIDRSTELDSKTVSIGNTALQWKERVFGKAPPNGHSLWISMHGGGGAPKAVNDLQWDNQISLYQLKEGIYIAPRAPTDSWNMWHQAHIDPLFSRLIENHILLRNVNPNKVYLLGYSAGGDGVWQLAPRMADRFAAAAMMAGHPNDSSLSGLRNLPFAIFIGANDHAYNRNRMAAENAKKLAALRSADPSGYIHMVRIYEGLGHWMNGKDQEALPWMAQFERDPWPKKIVWKQDDVMHDRFYWLKLPKGTAKKGATITAAVDGQHIRLEGDVPAELRVRLSDALLNLDRPVKISVNEVEVFHAMVKRDENIIAATLTERLDPAAAAYAEITVKRID